MRRRSLGLCILLGVGQAFAGELRWGFSPADGMPYVDIVDHQLQGGFTRQLGERVAQRLGLSLRFVETPNRRIDGFMASGHIHVICNSNPGWDSKPERYHWSPALFEEQDVLLQRDDRPAIRDFAELRGKTLGTSLGYVYADDLMQAFAAGEIRREDTRDLASRVQMLKRSRLDAAVDMRRPLLYLTRQHPELGLSVSPLVLQSYRMHCIYGGQLPVPVESMDRVLDEMVRTAASSACWKTACERLRNPERAPPWEPAARSACCVSTAWASRQTLKASSSDCQRRTTQARTARSSSRPTPKMKSGTISTGERK